jgi:predicted site-specific integrase-resolvase
MHKRRVRIRIKAASRQVFRLGGQNLRAFCPACGREVETLNMEQAGEILEVGERDLKRLIAAGPVHAIETVSGSIRVCKESLF